MLKQPFSGKELFISYEIEMGRFNRSTYLISELPHEEDEMWDMIGKTKKQAWNNLAKMINSRMQMEVLEGDKS